MSEPLFPFSSFNLDTVLFDLEEIRKINPQRYEMEQLTAVVHVDQEANGLVGYKDVTDDEFWIRGHMPGYPLMPGVVQCECAAQLAGFYARTHRLVDGDYLGFGAMNSVRFRQPVYPNCRLVLMAQVTRLRRGRVAQFAFHGYVDETLCFSGEMTGVSINQESAS